MEEPHGPRSKGRDFIAHAIPSAFWNKLRTTEVVDGEKTRMITSFLDAALARFYEIAEGKAK